MRTDKIGVSRLELRQVFKCCLIIPMPAELIILGLLVSGCSSFSEEQITLTATSLVEAETAGLALYDELYPILQSENREAAAYPITLGPLQLDGVGCANRYAGADSLVERCHAFAAAIALIDALKALAEGQRAYAITSRLEGGVSAAAGLVGAVGMGGVSTFLSQPAANALLAILRESLAFEDRVALRRKLAESAPFMQDLIDALQADVTRPESGVFAILRKAYELRLTEKANTALTALDEPVDTLAGRAPPRDADTLVAFRAAEARLDLLLLRPEPQTTVDSVAKLMDSNGPPLTNSEVARITESIAAAEAAYAAFAKTGAAFSPLRRSVIAYRDMLIALEIMFVELVATSTNPLAPGGSITQLTGALRSIREQVIIIENALD